MLAPDLPSAAPAAPLPGSPAAPSGANPVIDTAAASASTTASTTASALLTVLDSNVWIDILVFDDPDSRPIRTALETGTLAAVIDPACLYELDRVLDYPQFARFALDKAAALATTLRLACLLDAAPPAPPIDGGMAGAAAAMPLPSTPPLPRCSDRDDQKFLELAARSGARWLVTKDKALLKLARRFTRDFACRIDRPGDFVAAALSPPEARPGQPD